MKQPLRRKIISLALFFSTRDKKIQKDKMQWPKERKKAKRVDTTYKTNPNNTVHEFMCSRKVSSLCFTSDTLTPKVLLLLNSGDIS